MRITPNQLTHTRLYRKRLDTFLFLPYNPLMRDMWRKLSFPAKALAVFVAIGLYLLSLIPVSIGLYQLKTWLDIDLLQYGGWHAFSRCLDQQRDALQDQLLIDKNAFVPR